jgi:hypothetical protein
MVLHLKLQCFLLRVNKRLEQIGEFSTGLELDRAIIQPSFENILNCV